ncbi:MAG: ester cyclase [Leptolyngbyaceae cyanobacterium bins.302]|nr:ester cyclase [Leptolyngbyaceae cyanobacterium bins.302]
MVRWSSKKLFPAIALMTLMSCAGQSAVQEKTTATQTTDAATQTSTADTQVAQAFTPSKNNDLVVMVYNGAWNEGKLDLLDQYIAPDGLDHSPLSTEKGTAGFKKIISTFRSAMPGLKLTIEDEIFDKDKVVHRWTVQGKHTGAPLFGVPASGKEITLKGISILRMENGKIAERWTNLDQFGLLSQLGVIPPPKAPPTAEKK